MAVDTQIPNLHTIESASHFQELLSEDLKRISLLNFWAPWAEPCKQMNEVVVELAKKYPQVLVLQVSGPATAGLDKFRGMIDDLYFVLRVVFR